MKKLIVKAIIVFGVLLLLLPVMIRVFNGMPLMPGSESYGHARMAGIIAQSGIPKYDPAMPERRYVPNAFDILLAGFAKLLGIEAAAMLLPLVLGVLSVLCFYAVLKRWQLPLLTVLSIMVVFVISPFFVSTFTQAISRSLELFLFILLFLLVSPPKGKRSADADILFVIIAVFVAALLSSFGIIPALAAFALPMLLRTVSKRIPASMLASSLAAFIVLVVVALPQFLQQEQAPFGKPVFVVQAISDFGGTSGLSLFAWLLALMGFVLLWQFKKKYYAAMIAMGITLVVSLITPSALPAAHLLTAFLAGNTLAFLAGRKWAFDDMRVLTVFVIVCGLLFSTLTQGIFLARGPPTKEIKDAAVAIKSLLPGKTILLSHPNNGFWLEYWSGRQAYLDDWPSLTPGIATRWAVAQAVWHSQDITNARALLYKHKIGALVITGDMKDGLVWDLPEQDLLFLLRNNETFKNVYHSALVDIWAVIPPKKPE
ncbi:MAG: hypothetical protein QXT19_02010 [Candidatus Woesearchaeota archaeon]